MATVGVRDKVYLGVLVLLPIKEISSASQVQAGKYSDY